MEATMRTYLIQDLFRLTRTELFQLHAQILAELAALPEDSPDRLVALDTLRLIRSFLARRGPAP
jgi:hypothetical protein